MDHFGGFNTFLSTFAYGGTAICLKGRDPEAVAKIIQESQANLLPTTPTFLNFLIMSKQYAVYDLSSIELITYGTEPMPEATLKKVKEIFPNARLKQTYGLSELGVLRSESKEDGSLWLKIGGDGFETKVLDETLWVRSEANMVGYLNAPNPFDEDGWMCTGDVVEEKDGYFFFKGRKTEVINTGGKKVFPIEVENILIQLPNIRNATVEARPHPIMGQVVQARISLIEPEDSAVLSERLRTECNNLLARYKVPVRYIIVDDETLRSARFKKVRAIIP
jgi:acyl-CoA synthetase (AMP-forming)/AMP-acid ligase II